MYVGFIDWKKAFDMVNKSLLWAKLIKLGLNGRFLKIIQNIYDEVKACVKGDKGELSDKFMCLLGVK